MTTATWAECLAAKTVEEARLSWDSVRRTKLKCPKCGKLLYSCKRKRNPPASRLICECGEKM